MPELTLLDLIYPPSIDTREAAVMPLFLASHPSDGQHRRHQQVHTSITKVWPS